MNDTSHEHEKALAKLDIRAEVRYVAFDRVTVTLSTEHLDWLIDQHQDEETTETALEDASKEGEEAGREMADADWREALRQLAYCFETGDEAGAEAILEEQGEALADLVKAARA